MRADLRKSINSLKRDREHGAGWMALQAVRILENACRESTARSIEKLKLEIDDIAEALIQARPAMVSIANYSLRFQEEFGVSAVKTKSLEGVKQKGTALAEKLVRQAEKTTYLVARNAVKLLARRNIVLTCSYSSSVCNALELAKNKGVDFKVLAVESRLGRISYGKITAERLKKAGISCRLVPDGQIDWHTARANTILIGADTVSLHGWLINGTPSLELAQVAERKKVPVYAVCETAKFDVRGFLAGLRRAEPGFDMVPLELITGIVTEHSILQPDDAYKVTFEDIFRSPHARTD